jgi:hypothetical protein
MNRLHIVAGRPASVTLLEAIRGTDRMEDVLRFPDDLSCGPIETDEPSARSAWWDQYYEEPSDMADHLREFWQRVANPDEQLVVWFTRDSALEHAFFLAWVKRLGDRPFQIVDLTGQRLPVRRRDGSIELSVHHSVGIVQAEALRSLLGRERPIGNQERDESSSRWRLLQRENAPFRIISEARLVSAPIDYFDPWLLAQVTSEWQSVNVVVTNTMVYNSDPYDQVGSMMLMARIVALAEQGRLIVEGDPMSILSRVRLPDVADPVYSSS